MASQETFASSGSQGSPKEGEELTLDKLIIKYKTLMALTNKIKTARNEALTENGALKNEIEAATEKIKVLKQQNITAEEMLAALTDQKLKMAMEIDDMKKEKQQHLKNMKEVVGKEADNCKLENEKMKKENNDLFLKLQDKEKKESQLQNDLIKLHENNENVIVLCSNIRKEKIDLQNKLEEVCSALTRLEDEKKGILELLSKQFNQNFSDFIFLKKFLVNELNTYCSYQYAEEINLLLDKNLNLKNKVEELSVSMTSILKEKESAETHLFNLNSTLEKLKTELSLVTSDRDQIMNNLDSVRLETKQLIENSEKLVEELELLKTDKNKNEQAMHVLISDKNEEINLSRKFILDLQQENEELKSNLFSCREYLCSIDDKKCNCFKTIDGDDNNYNLFKETSKNDDHVNASQFTPDINILSHISSSFNKISESIRSINLKLLEKEVQTSETELLKVINRLDGTSQKEEDVCPKIKCGCLLLRNIGLRLKENVLNYEKNLIDLKHDIELIREQYNILLNREIKCETTKEEVIYRDKTNFLDFQECKDSENECILTKLEEYYALNNLLEKKILICREELGYALIQLRNAEELEELMQQEIYSLQKQLSEVVTEREILNEIINDKVKIIIKLNEELTVEQSKSSKLEIDLETSQNDLVETKDALDENCKSIIDINNEKTSITTKVLELRDTNQKLVEENDLLKFNIEKIIKQNTAKLKDVEDNKQLILDLKDANEQLKCKLFKLETANSKVSSKLSTCKINVGDVRKEILRLKKQFNDLQGNTSNQLCTLRIANQEVFNLIQDQSFAAANFNQEMLSKKEIKIQDEEVENVQLQATRNTTLFEEKSELESLQKKQFVDQECQIDFFQDDNLLQDGRKGSEVPNDVTAKSAEVEDLTEHKIQSLETSLALSKQELATAHIEISQLREEFHSYRLRAQALLSKQKGGFESQGEKEAKEQIEKLNNELESIRIKMEMLLLEDDSLKNRLSTIQSEKEITDKKYEDISRALHQKIIDYDSLTTEYNAFKLSTDTLIHNGKILLEEKYKSEINAKEAVISKLKSEIKEKHIISDSVDTIHEVSECTHSIHNMEEILQEREEGEGSETAATPFTETHEFVPLDVLINNSVDDEENQVTVLQEQVNMLTTELSSHDIRSKHLSSLLREAEKESARNSQQNSVLKEELRRLERCLERQPLVANTEYLKNVVFKFFTLQSADERSRLVPVLDSILKLSPAEAQKLNEIARGEGASRWSNYLHSWTGLG